MTLSPQFVSDGLFRSELNSFLKQELAEDGYSGVEVRVTPTRTEIIILATRTQNVLGEKGRRIRELTAVVQKRFNFPEGTVEVSFGHLLNYCLCIIASRASLLYPSLVDWKNVSEAGSFLTILSRMFLLGSKILSEAVYPHVWCSIRHCCEHAKFEGGGKV